MRAAALGIAAGLSLGCAAPGRFALRLPVARVADDRPFAPAPAYDEEQDYANALDDALLRPLSHAFLFQHAGEAKDVNALDEVPDSAWFTNRTPRLEQWTMGPCTDAPKPPYTVNKMKVGGTAPGFIVVDARGVKYLLKFDMLAPRQPEISTAADVIVSRFYWAIGFNTPCNGVIELMEADLRLAPGAVKKSLAGDLVALVPSEVRASLAKATRGPHGGYRMTTSQWVEGKGIGTWRTAGTRSDDPNDAIPHEDRRELRAELLLAGWLAHWDSRGPNTFDTFVTSRGKAGYVKHFFIDFNDCLGGMSVQTKWAEPRWGFTTMASFGQIGADTLTFGVIRRPWDEVKLDPLRPNLGYLDVEHYDPLSFSARGPLVRWARADASDLGWMARKMARIGPAEVRLAVELGKLTSASERERLIEILMGRRERALRTVFDASSPLGEPSLHGDRLCLTDLAIVGGVARPRVAYSLDVVDGARPLLPEALAGDGARVCVRMPLHAALGSAADDSPERYVVLELFRDDGVARTRLRAHFYDLEARGWFLAGIDRSP